MVFAAKSKPIDSPQRMRTLAIKRTWTESYKDRVLLRPYYTTKVTALSVFRSVMLFGLFGTSFVLLSGPDMQSIRNTLIRWHGKVERCTCKYPAKCFYINLYILFFSFLGESNLVNTGTGKTIAV